jgi:beta-lactamase superfamily II metal-dependent hydrolase
MIKILRFFITLVFLLTFNCSTFAQAANGKLQIHFMDVGQGDGAILVSPQGQTVLFDGGRTNRCDLPLSYLQQMGISSIDFLIISHYHADHFGCTPPELQEFPLTHEAFDRGFNYGTTAYTNYIQAVGSHRTSLTTPGRKITLDAGSATPVTIEVIALNGNGVTTDNENDLSLVALVTFGKFKAEIGGDLSGFAVTRNFGSTVVEYKDIETSVAPRVGPINVYKVHHHCSAYSSNEAWLAATRPQIAIISSGDGNTYGHPAPDCVQRLHAANIQKLYWTERGAGASPVPGLDVVGGNIIVEVPSPGTGQYSVTYSGTRVDTYTIPSTVSPPPLPGGPTPVTSGPVYIWSKKAKVYHYANCSYARNISPGNIQQGDTPPQGKRLHTACPIVHTSPDSGELTDVPQPPN